MSGPDQGLAQIAALLKNTTPPDVLETIAHISSDEVLTPPKLANRVLDLLPAHIWHDPRIRILDPAVKSGVFLREAAKRLMAGLADVIPDVTERREHILRKMLYGVAITELTALMSRRSLYCASDATRRMNPDAPENCFSAVIMDTPEGNIAFPETDHAYDVRGKCRVCGANRGDLDGEHREGRENHAYPFIHRTIEEIFGEDMQFDVIIGNPPYQISDGGGGNGSSATPIYQHFVRTSKKLSPKYMSFIIPARWYSGGKGLDDFREEMISDKRISNILDYLDSKECFPGVSVEGGISIFLREEFESDSCAVHTIRSGKKVSSCERSLSEFPYFIRRNEAVSIIRKVRENASCFLEGKVSPRNPFGISTDFSDFCENHGPGKVKIFARGKTGYIEERKIPKGDYRKFNVYASVVYGSSGSEQVQVMGKPIYSEEPSCSTGTYLVLGSFESVTETYNYYCYAKTKFFRFMLLQLKTSQIMSRKTFSFVPDMDMSRTWTDADLYAHFGLTNDEIAFIEATVKEMP